MSPNNPNETIISVIMHNNSEKHLKNKSINGLGRSDAASAGLTTTSNLYQVIYDNEHFLAFREPEFLCRLCNVVIGCNLNQMSYQSLVAHFINEAHFSKASSELAAYVALHFGGSQRHEFNVSNNNIYCLICKCFVGQNVEEILRHVRQLPTYQLTNPFSLVNVEEGRHFREVAGNNLPSSSLAIIKMESQETKSDNVENIHKLFPKKKNKKQGKNKKKKGNEIKLIAIRPINNDDHNVHLPGIDYIENAKQCSQSSTRNANGLVDQSDQSSTCERKENVTTAKSDNVSYFIRKNVVELSSPLKQLPDPSSTVKVEEVLPLTVGNKFLSALESAVSKKESQENKSGTQEDIYEFLVPKKKKKKGHQNIHLHDKGSIKLSNDLEMLKNLQEHLEEFENRCITSKVKHSRSEIFNEVLAKIRKTQKSTIKLKKIFNIYRGEIFCTLCYVPLSSDKDEKGSNLIEKKILSHLEESKHKSQISTYSTKLIIIQSIKVLMESTRRIKEDIKPCFLEGLFACTLCNCLTNYNTVMLHLQDINHIQRKALQVESISYQRKAKGLEAAKLLPKAMCIRPSEGKTPSKCKTEDLKAVKCLMENMIDIKVTEFKTRPDANQNKDKSQKPVQNIGLSSMSSLLSKIEKKVPW